MIPRVVVPLLVALLASAGSNRAADLRQPPAHDRLVLPPLVLDGTPATAHTQGIEFVGDSIFVTARREDVRPNRALLLRTTLGAKAWEAWDLTPRDAQGQPTSLNHPGGFQSDGARLWIPVAESLRHGKTRIRVYSLDALGTSVEPRPVLDLPVDDHIGALAVSKDLGRVVGASWDTELVYVWTLTGKLERTLTATDLRPRDLGVSRDDPSRAGLTVQDWKFDGARLLASGLYKGDGDAMNVPRSRLIRFDRFLDPGFVKITATVPMLGDVELCHEAMGVKGGAVHVLPQDLGPTNRLYRLAAELVPR